MNFFVDLLTTSLYRRGSKIHQTIILENSMRLDFSGKYYFYHFIYDTWQYMTKSRFLSCIVMYPGSPLKQQHTKVFPRRLVTKWSSWTISFTQKRPSWKILIHRKEIPFARHLAWHKYSSPVGCTLRVGTRPHLGSWPRCLLWLSLCYVRCLASGISLWRINICQLGLFSVKDN